MKKWFFMLICMVAFVLPQNVWAQTVPSIAVDGTKLTITTSSAGQVTAELVNSALNDAGSSASNITDIVLVGYFNSSDLEVIKGDVDGTEADGDFTGVTTVNMAEARFVQNGSTAKVTGLSFLYHNVPDNPNIYEGSKVIVGSTLYKVTAAQSQWEEVTNPTSSTEVGFSDEDKNDYLSKYSDDAIIKIVPANYYVLSINRNWERSNTQPTSGTKIGNIAINQLNSVINQKNPNDYVEYIVYNYYKYVIIRTWELVENPTDEVLNQAQEIKRSQYESISSYEASNPSKNENDHVKFALTYNYYQKIDLGNNSYEWQKVDALPEGETASDVNFLENDIITNAGTHAGDSEYAVGAYIRFGKSYQCYKYVWNRQWQSIMTSSTDHDVDEIPSSFIGHYEDEEVRYDTKGRYYYQLIETKSWGGPMPSMPSDKNFNEVVAPSWNESERDSHLIDYNLNQDGLCIRFVTGGETKYYKRKTVRTWEQQNYTDGSQYNISHRFESAYDPSVGNLGEYGLVNGTDYAKGNSGVSTDIKYNYSEMKFSYWGGSLKTAVTSKYADNTINNEIFSNCKKLSSVDYKAGNVTGFGDHSASQEYTSPLSVTIGKNVTSIDASAFLRCDVLKTLNFDKDYESSNGDKLTGVNYPIDFAIGAEAFHGCTSLQGVEIPNRVISIGNYAFQDAGNSSSTGEFLLYFERRSASYQSDHTVGIDHDVNLTIGSSAFLNCKYLKTLELPIRLVSMGGDAFRGTTHLTNMLIREDQSMARLKTIPTGAFAGSGIQTLLVPKSVTLIEDAAFQSCQNLKTVTFQEQKGTDAPTPQEALLIKSGAFTGGTETAINEIFVVDCEKRKLVCEYNAFNFTAMEAQTQEGVELTKLKLASDDDENFNYYVGNWKKGLAFSQNNLNAMKDGYTGTNNGKTYKGMALDVNSISTGTGFYESGDSPTLYAAANGWQQFASSTSKREVQVVGDVFMTYSSDKAYSLPAGLLAFRVTNYSAYTPEGNLPVGGQMTLKNIGYLPKNTGVILISTNEYIVTNGQDASIIFFGDTNETTEYPYQETGDNANLLVPAVSKVNIGPVSWGPTSGTNTFSLSGSGSFDHRNFGMHKTYHYFARLKRITMPDNRAFLSLPTNLFKEEDEGMEGGPKLIETTAGKAGSVYDPSISGGSSAPLLFDYDFEMYGVVWPLGDLDMLYISQPTDIKDIAPIEHTNVVEGIFTLQGVRVTTTTPGNIYIIKGKKVYVK